MKISIGFYFVCVGRNSSFIFRALELSVGKKIKCAVCVVGFLVQMLMVSSVSALLTTRYMENKLPVYRFPFPDNRTFCSRLFFSFKYNEIYYKDALDFFQYYFNWSNNRRKIFS